MLVIIRFTRPEEAIDCRECTRYSILLNRNHLGQGVL